MCSSFLVTYLQFLSSSFSLYLSLFSQLSLFLVGYLLNDSCGQFY